MTIKKNTIIIILAISLTLCATGYFINNKKKTLLAHKEEIVSNGIINKSTPNNDKTKDLSINKKELIVKKEEKSNIDIKDNVTNNKDITFETTTDNNEEEIIQHFRAMEMSVTEDTNESTLDKVKDKIDNAFFTIIDFLFYDKEIKGVTFDELSDEAKIEILSIASRIDDTIIKKFPNYKENIKDNGNKVYIFSKEQINKLQHSIKNKIGDDKYNNIVDNIEKGKDKIIDVKDNAFNSIKNWYENKRNKARN